MSLQLCQFGNEPWAKKSSKLALSLVVALSLTAGIAFAATDTTDPDIVKLEKRFFEHDYPKDTTDARLDRLEKMVFGEAKTGSDKERLTALLSVVNLSDNNSSSSSSNDKSTPSYASTPASTPTKSTSLPPADVKDYEDTAPPGASYPAVSAIERKLFGREFNDEPVRKRLDRLEVKEFGKPSGLDDMTERMDRLKSRTGVDVAKQAPVGSDWADDDDFSFDSPANRPSQSMQNRQPPITYTDPDGTSFSGRNVRQDMQRAFGNSSGMQSGTQTGMQMGSPVTAPDYRRITPPSYQSPNAVPSAPASAVGLNQQVTYLEQLIFGKAYTRDSLPARVNRLEMTLFPGQQLAVTTPMPDRVRRLLGTVPGAATGANGGRAYGSNPADMSSADDFDDMPMTSQYPKTAPSYQSQSRSGGLSKIINSIGSMLGNGYGGGYTTGTGMLVTDPQTGLLYDQASGALIDPLTGAVVGQRYPTAAPSYGGFNNGFSPYGSAPYGMGMGSGMRFGFGGIGGMWP